MTDTPPPTGCVEREPSSRFASVGLQRRSNGDATLSKRAETGSGSDLNWAEWNMVGRPHVFLGSHPKLKSVRAYLLGVKSVRARALVRAAVRKGAGRGWEGMNAGMRVLLHDSIFKVMDDLESRSVGQPDRTTVIQLRVALNLVADDLRWNESSAMLERTQELLTS